MWASQRIVGVCFELIFVVQILWRDVDARQKLKIYLAYETVLPVPVLAFAVTGQPH